MPARLSWIDLKGTQDRRLAQTSQTLSMSKPLATLPNEAKTASRLYPDHTYRSAYAGEAF
ncbi:hypothetical protein QYM36_001466, partial [Artemia franciscana]